MEIRHGIPVSPGIVIAEALVLDSEKLRIPQRFVEKGLIESEIGRFKQAVDDSNRTLDTEIARLGEEIEIHARILGVHQDLASDPVLHSEVEQAIRDNSYTAEHALSKVMNRYVRKLQDLKSPILSERVHDLQDVEKLLLSTLLGKRIEGLSNLKDEVVVIAHNLTPAQTAKLDPEMVKGFATDVGGKTSHTAIMGRALGIPAVVGLEDIATAVVGGDLIVIDGYRGVVVIDPDEGQIAEYSARARKMQSLAKRLKSQAKLPAETIDGHRIEVHANIELPSEVKSAVECGASGIGLYRTEFIHLQAPTAGEEVHFENYRSVIESLGGLPLTVRTLDLGGDKLPEGGLEEENPFLGCRSIRWCLANPKPFRAQIRAILRAGLLGPVRLMLPMITSISELDRSLQIIDEVSDELRAEGVEFDENIPIGVMVEVPSLALIASHVAGRVSFLSVGTNDLVQYTLAVDRGNEHVADLYDPMHPAVLHLILQLVRTGQEHSVRVSLCGEMASESIYLPLLVGMGLREISVSPQLIPEVKQVIRSLVDYEVRELSARCLQMSDGEQITRELHHWAVDHFPEVVDRF
ncbi:MAG: phosphoenolpyruvate--protein phosphotransferase [Bacillota bacterium]|nr:MAG: phosphoenolpyruvate--protein phosphotransferase [Planctomycetota bacterium]RUA08550.1 MAG: phosphoenolpyruvate--protein phosphotransferase [Bacillota bacterium]